MRLPALARTIGMAWTCAAVWALPAHGQQRVTTTAAEGGPATILTKAQAESAIGRIADDLRLAYVAQDQVGVLNSKLDMALVSGRFNTESPATFAEKVSTELQAATHDKHLYLQYDPARYAAASTPSPASGDDALAAFEKRVAIRDHYGLAETKLLAGNVRYLRITAFQWVDDQTGSAYDDAARFLRDGDAIIIDLRGNPGGTHAAVDYLVSHFLKPGTAELTLREGVERRTYHSLDYLPAGRLIGKPLYVLIDHGVGSAAEAFAYDVQQFKLGELVGATTVGAANNNRFFPIAPGFMLSVPYGRPTHAVSGGNWEGQGVAPDVPVAPEQALDLAHERALERLERGTAIDPAQRADWEWARSGLAARRHPVSIGPAVLAGYVGRYETVSVEQKGDALWMTAGSQAAMRLIPFNADGAFFVEGYDALRVRFHDNRIELQWSDEPSPRVHARS